MIIALVTHLAVVFLGSEHHGPPMARIEVDTGSWWMCSVDYEGRHYFSEVFSGEKPKSVYEALFARFVEDSMTGHFRAAECEQHRAFEETLAHLQREIAYAGRQAEPTNWTPLSAHGTGPVWD